MLIVDPTACAQLSKVLSHLDATRVLRTTWIAHRALGTTVGGPTWYEHHFRDEKVWVLVWGQYQTQAGSGAGVGFICSCGENLEMEAGCSWGWPLFVAFLVDSNNKESLPILPNQQVDFTCSSPCITQLRRNFKENLHLVDIGSQIMSLRAGILKIYCR